MKHVIHHFRWLLWRYRFGLVAYAVLWAVFTACVWLIPAGITKWHHFLWGMGGLVLWGVLLLLDAVWQDTAPGTDTFWRTRPPRWRSVWASQLLFLTVPVAGPPVLAWLANGLMMQNTAAQWRQGSVDVLCFAGALLALAGLASFSRRWLGLTIALVVLALSWQAGWMLWPWALQQWTVLMWPLVPLDPQIDFAPVRMAVVFAGLLAVIVSWGLGMRRLRRWRRAVAVALVLLLLPSILTILAAHARPHMPAVRILDLAVRPGNGPLREGEQEAGDLMLKGVPAGAVAVMEEERLGVATSEFGRANFGHQAGVADGGTYLGSYGSFSRFDSNKESTRRHPLLEGAGPILRQLLPAGIRWYSDGWQNGEGSPVGPPKFYFHQDWDSRFLTPPPVWLKGTARGYFVSAVQLVSVPLEKGAGGAANGSRVGIATLEYTPEALSLAADVWIASKAFEPVQPQNETGPPPWRDYAVPVLYFPAVPMAILLKQASPERQIRSWQCTVRRLEAKITLPAAESVLGTTFSSGTMRGARLILCAPVTTGFFEVRCPEGPQQITKYERNTTSELYSLLSGSSWTGDSKGRAELLRRLFAERHGYEFSNPWVSRKSEWWTWITDEFLPDLIEAVRREPRWMDVAWRAGHEVRLRSVARDHLRSARGILPVSVVAAAASMAEDTDYPLLRHHLLLAAEPVDSSVPHLYAELCRRLRLLPGFDWKAAVLFRWEAVETGYFDDADKNAAAQFAALAGNTAALREALGNFHEENNWSLTPAETLELTAMIEGCPPDGPVREYWIENHREFLTWDASQGKYAVKN